MLGNAELSYDQGNWAVNFDGKLSSPFNYSFDPLIENPSTRREHDNVVQHRSFRIGHLRQSTLLRPTPEEGRQSSALFRECALHVFAAREGSLALGLVQTVHAQGDVVLGTNHLGAHSHRSRRAGRRPERRSRKRHGDGPDQTQDPGGRRTSPERPRLAELGARASLGRALLGGRCHALPQTLAPLDDMNPLRESLGCRCGIGNIHITTTLTDRRCIVKRAGWPVGLIRRGAFAPHSPHRFAAGRDGLFCVAAAMVLARRLTECCVMAKTAFTYSFLALKSKYFTLL